MVNAFWTAEQRSIYAESPVYQFYSYTDYHNISNSHFALKNNSSASDYRVPEQICEYILVDYLLKRNIFLKKTI